MPGRPEFTFEARMEAQDTAEVTIGGVIVPDKSNESDVTASEFARALKSCAGARRLNVHINSGGGSVAQAVAIRTMLIAHEAEEKHVYIDGMAASAATLAACIGAPVHMASGSMYMIHNPISLAWGDYRQLRHDADVLDRYADMFAGIYAERIGKAPGDVRAMMDAETWMTAEEAVENGFADDVTGARAVACVSREELARVYACAQPQYDAARYDAAQAARRDIKTEEEFEMDWQSITLDELKAQRPDIVRALADEAAGAERERIRAIDEAAGLTDEAADAAKYVDLVDAGAYALSALRNLRAQSPAARYQEARAQETRALSAVGAEPVKAQSPAEGTADEIARALAGALGGAGKEC